jgi:predicted secreted protein
MSDAVTATGILVKRALLASPTVFTTIGEIVSVTPPGFSRNKIDTTTHNEGAESSVLGILRQKDPSFRINYVGGNATHASILSDIQANTKNQWQVLFPSGVSFTGPARVQRFEMVDVPVDAAQQADITLAWAGAVTHAAS